MDAGSKAASKSAVRGGKRGGGGGRGRGRGGRGGHGGRGGGRGGRGGGRGAERDDGAILGQGESGGAGSKYVKRKMAKGVNDDVTPVQAEATKDGEYPLGYQLEDDTTLTPPH